MYGIRDYLAYLRYGAMWLFQDEILPWQLLVTGKSHRSCIAIDIAQSLSYLLEVIFLLPAGEVYKRVVSPSLSVPEKKDGLQRLSVSFFWT